VKNKKSNFTIVVWSGAPTINRKAATVLQEYIFKISGCSIPITATENPATKHQIIVGTSKKLVKTDTAGLGADGILIKMVNNTLLITGGNRKGVLYAAYTFLEDYLGCHYYGYGNLKVPQTNVLMLPARINKKETPSFDYRMMHFPDAFDPNYCDWRKINYVFEDWGLWVHSFKDLAPASLYFKSHPEYFALINGRRDSAQLCPSNAQLPIIVANHLREKIKAMPNAKYWSVSQNDNPNYCKCDQCNRITKEQESPTGALLNLVNKVAAQFPNKIITTLAYGYSEKPPKTMRPGNNVMIMLTTATVNDRRLPLTENRSLEFHQHLKKWSAITKELMVWDYLVKYANLLLPLPNIAVYQPNVQYFAANGAKYLFLQGHGNIVGEFSELKGYLTSKLMWNKNLDITVEKKKFLKDFYGPVGGTYMEEYIDLVTKEASLAKSSMLILQRDDPTVFTTYLSPRNIGRYKQIFDQALNRVDNNSPYSKRLLKEYSALLYAELENDRWEMSKVKSLSVDKRNACQQRIENWRNKVKQTSVEVLSESRTPVEDYYQQYKQQLKTISVNNR
jgi:hypothetical protein